MLPRLVRLFKLSRLFRMARLQCILRRVQLQLGIRNSTNKILKFSGAAILCMFCATSQLQISGLGGADSVSWVERLGVERDQLDRHSLTTMTSIGLIRRRGDQDAGRVAVRHLRHDPGRRAVLALHGQLAGGGGRHVAGRAAQGKAKTLCWINAGEANLARFQMAFDEPNR